jgi:exopolyphosphatase/pppGpp-phosphohydrolase
MMSGDNSFIGIHQESTKVRLGESLAFSDSLSEQSILKSIDVLLLYRDIIRLDLQIRLFVWDERG